MWGKLPGGCRAAAGTACVCADLCLAAACSATTTTTTTTPLLPLPCGTPTAAALTTAPPVWRCRAQVGFPGRPHGGARALHQHVSTPGVAQPLPWPRGSAGRRGGAGGGVLGPCRRRGRPSGIRWNQEAAHPPSPQLPWGVLLRDPGAARRGPSNAVPSANHFWRPAPPQPPDLVAPPFRAPPSRFHPPQHWFLVTTPITPPPSCSTSASTLVNFENGALPDPASVQADIAQRLGQQLATENLQMAVGGGSGAPPRGGGGGEQAGPGAAPAPTCALHWRHALKRCAAPTARLMYSHRLPAQQQEAACRPCGMLSAARSGRTAMPQSQQSCVAPHAAAPAGCYLTVRCAVCGCAVWLQPGNHTSALDAALFGTPAFNFTPAANITDPGTAVPMVRGGLGPAAPSPGGRAYLEGRGGGAGIGQVAACCC